MYTNLLTIIKNGQQAKKATVKVQYSNGDFAVAELLVKHKLLDSVAKKGRMPKRILEAKLRYDSNGVGAIRGVKFLSKPSRRLYAGYQELNPVNQGFGVLVLSTPKGIVDGKTARKEKVGGELMFQIW